MDLELVKWLGTLGVGGALAAFMFYFYRQDVRTYTDQWRGQSDQLISVVKENTSTATHLIVAIDNLGVATKDASAAAAKAAMVAEAAAAAAAAAAHLKP